MFSLAFSLIKNHKAGLAGVFVVVLLGSAVLTACAILINSGLRGGFPPERYAAASVVVGAPQSLSVPGDFSQPYGERVKVPAGWASEISRVPGVKSAVGDVSVPVSLVAGTGKLLAGTSDKPIMAHGWSSAALGPFTITAGTVPQRPGEVVLDTALAAQADVRPGDSIEVLSGSVPVRYRGPGGAAARRPAAAVGGLPHR
jgi:putative ABC transport system permease protein